MSLKSILKRKCPAVHHCLRSIPASWLHYDRLPVPKRVAGTLIWTQRRLVTSEQPESHIIEWVRETLCPGDVFFDVGAHYGWVSIAALSRLGSFGRAVAFEASPVLIDILYYHKRINRLTQMEIVPKAITDLADSAVPFFLVNNGLSFRNSLTIGMDDVPYLTAAEKTRCYVASISLDQFSSDSGTVPNLIKIDVEGGELFVLKGAERLIPQSRPTLILSVHPYWLPKSQTISEIFEFLDRHRYKIRKKFVIEFNGGVLSDYLCIPLP